MQGHLARLRSAHADRAALATIHGIGQAKLERWGETILRVIRGFPGTGMATADPGSG